MFQDSNMYQYLTKCLVVAHHLNAKFHLTMRTFVGTMNSGNNKRDIKAIYREAAVKTRERYVVLQLLCLYL